MAKAVGAMMLFIFWQERKADVQKLGKDLETSCIYMGHWESTRDALFFFCRIFNDMKIFWL